MKGQLNIEFIAGSILFIVAMSFVVTQSLGTIPQFEETLTVNNRHIEATAVTRFLLKQPGHWSTNSDSGTDWENHADDTTILGLSTGTPHVVNRSKAAALVDNASSFTVNYSEALTVLDIDTRTPGNVTRHDVAFQIHNITEYAVIEAFNTYNKSSDADDVPEKISEPDDSMYTDSSVKNIVHYGRSTINDASVQVLIANASTGDDANIYVTTQDWNFTDTTGFDNTETHHHVFHGETYTVHGNNTAAVQSQGTTLVLTRELLQNPPYGPNPPFTAGQVVQQEHYGNTVDGHLVKLVAEVWRDE